MALVYFDPAHGGHDPGAVDNGLQEKHISLSICKYAKEHLESNYNGVEVRLTRSDDRFISLSGRAQMANDAGADVFVSPHVNAGGGEGYEDYIFNGPVSNATHELQDAVHNEVAPLFSTNRGQKRANFAVLRETKMSAILTENGFIDNKSDANFLSKESNLKKLGEAHAKGVAVFLGLAKGSSKTKKSTSKKTTTKSKASSKPKANLKVDGYWGKATTRALQRYFGTPVDGEIWGQYKGNQAARAITGGVKYGPPYGSPVIKAIQRKVGAKADGVIGPATVRKMQSHFGTPVDGEIWHPSTMVKEMQRRLNAGTF